MEGFLEGLGTADLVKLIRSVGIELPDETDRETCYQAILEADKVAPVLLGALKHPAGKIRAAAADALGEVGDSATRTYLQALMTDKAVEVRTAVVKAIEAIDARRPEDRTEIDLENPVPPDDYVRQLVLDAAARLKAQFTPSKTGFMLQVEVGKGKGQYVQVLFGKKDEENDPFVSFLSVCGKPSPSTLESIVKWNGRLNCGSVSLRKVGADEVLVLGCAQALTGVDYEEIEKMILYVAKRGNTLKQFLRAGY